MMKTNDFSLGVASELFSAGRNEDGEEVIGHAYFVVAESKTGRRFSHQDYFKDTAQVACDDSEIGFYFAKDSGAEEKAQASKNALALLEDMDLSQWHEDHPAYGSIAYQERIAEHGAGIDDDLDFSP